MWALGTYERLVYEIKRRENPDLPVTFGLLIADFDQQKCREYVLNYIDVFNYKSGEYINFYLPGYMEDEMYQSEKKITIKNKNYYFKREIFHEFLMKLEQDFGIDFPYNPVLILLEYDRGHFKMSKRIVIELDANGSQIERTGEFFEQIFSIARKVVSLDDVSEALVAKQMKNGLLDTIVGMVDNSYISAIYNKYGECKKYKLK
jgi:hypothetical protein